MFPCTATRQFAARDDFHKFRRQLFHSSLAKILETLKPGMSQPEVARFGDGHYRRIIYGLGPYIADYEEQVLLACIVRNWCPRFVFLAQCIRWIDSYDLLYYRCLSPRRSLDDDSLCRCQDHTEALVNGTAPGVLWDEYGIVASLVVSLTLDLPLLEPNVDYQPFTNDFPRADIHQLLAPDILHQLIKGSFKDHLVDWVEKYLKHVHGTNEAERIMDDIDHRCAPQFF